MNSRALIGRAGLIAVLGLTLSTLTPAQGAEGEPNAPNGEAPPADSTPITLPTAPTLPDVEPGTAVPFDLGSGEISALPFDVPFKLVTEVDESVLRLSGRYVGDTDPLACSRAFPAARLEVDYGFGSRPLAPIERRRIHGIEPWEADATKQGKQLASLEAVDGLLPNRYYCFEFSRVRKPELTQESLRSAMAAKVDLALRPLDSLLEEPRLRREAYEALRRAVIAAVEEQMEPGDRLVVPADSFLNRAAEDVALPAASRRRFDAVLQAQMERSSAVDGFLANSAEALVPALDRLVQRLSDGVPAAGGDLLAIRAAARQASPPADLQAVLRGKEAALAWAELALLSESDRQRAVGDIASGEVDAVTAAALASGAPGATEATAAQPWDKVWKPQDLEGRRKNLQRTVDSLGTLKSLVAELRDEGLASLAGASSGLSALRPAVSDVLGETDFLMGDVEAVEEELLGRETLIARLLEDLGREIVEALRLAGSTRMSYNTGGSWYLGIDFGFAWAEDIEDFFTYVGTNIYLRPVNKRATLRWSDFRKGQFMSELLKRSSVTVGITLRELQTTDNRFEGVSLEDELGVIANRPLILGAGLRLSRLVRLTAGALLFKEPNPDPLVDGSRLAWTPLISVSLDWNFKASARKRLTPPAKKSP